MRTKAFTRGERKAQIANAFIANMQQGLGNVLTVYQVAKKLKMSQSTHLQEIMLEMVEDGTLTFKTVNHRQTWKRLFSLVNVQPQTRNIRINGVQLEMKF